MTQRDYVNHCVGYYDKRKSEEAINRKVWYAIVQGWADHKKLQPVHHLWPIVGEEIPKVKVPSLRKLKQLDKIFKSIGKIKSNG